MALTEEQFIIGITILGAAFPEFACDPSTVDVYRERLCARLEPAEWEAAVKRIIDTAKYFPKVSEILRAAEAGRPTPAEIWHDLLVAAEQGEMPEVDGATEKALQAIGGWDVLQFTPYAELRWQFKVFKETLESAWARPEPIQKQLPEAAGARRLT